MKNMTINEFIEELSSEKPLGGGSACSLVASLAASLGSMVANLTIGKKKYSQYNEELTKLLLESNNMTQLLLQGIENDQIAFQPLSNAYKLSKDDPEREEIMQHALRQAALSPYNLLVDTTKVIDLLERYSKIGSIIVISDAATGAMLAYGALYGEVMNIKVNTSKITDMKFKNDLESKADELLTTYSQKALNIYNYVNERITNG